MSDHLPECPVQGERTAQFFTCICPELRACEARVAEGWKAHCNRVEGRTRMEALDAARDAVAALVDPVPDVERSMWTTSEVLAAIDALRGES